MRGRAAVARETHNLKVLGSNPSPATMTVNERPKKEVGIKYRVPTGSRTCSVRLGVRTTAFRAVNDSSILSRNTSY